jgi:hypothetical protein
VRLGAAFRAGDADIRPQALLRYDYDWNADDNDAHEIESSFTNVPSAGTIDIVGQNRGELGRLLARGITAQINEKANLYAGEGYRWNSNGEEYNFGVGARRTW